MDSDVRAAHCLKLRPHGKCHRLGLQRLVNRIMLTVFCFEKDGCMDLFTVFELITPDMENFRL